MPNFIQEFKDHLNKIYLLEDPYIIDLILALMITHRLPADPVWVVIVAPSSAGKSELINTISTCENVWPLSTVTSHTFISGAKKPGKETSLLLKIVNGILSFKDLTSILSENKDERAVIMAQLREIYDGRLSKSFGTGEDVKWEGKITVIAGATFAIHTLRQAYTSMGERFLFYSLVTPDRIEAGERAMKNQEKGEMTENRAILAKEMKDIIDNKLVVPENIPKITAELRKDILELAELATRARSDVARNYRSPKMEIIAVHPPEMPARFAGALQTVAKALIIIAFNETGVAELLDRHRPILYKLALDSVTDDRRIAMQILSQYDSIETSGLATKIGFPTDTVKRWLEDLVALGIAEREKVVGKRGDSWKILTKYKKILVKFEGIEVKEGALTEVGIEREEQNHIQKLQDDARSLLGEIEDVETPLEISMPEGL